jgi:hypothetical protein
MKVNCSALAQSFVWAQNYKGAMYKKQATDVHATNNMPEQR